jgi:hypothetical protein
MAKNSADKYFPGKKEGRCNRRSKEPPKGPLDGLASFCLPTLKAIIRFFCLTAQEEIRQISTKFAIAY